MRPQTNLLLPGTRWTSRWTVDVDAGWNWLAYPIGTNISVNDALALLQAREGDVLKNQTSFAIYDPVVGWSGTLNYLKAGEGYMLKSSKDQEFSYPKVFQTKSSGGKFTNSQESAPVAPTDWSTYENNMSIVAEINSEVAFDEVWVTDRNGKVRGKAVVETSEGRKLSYITVFGNMESSDDLSVMLVNQDFKVGTGLSLNFSPDTILGTFQHPVMLQPERNRLTVYPNPFDAEFRISVDVEESQECQVMLMNVIGQEVYRRQYSLQKGINELHISPVGTSGVYILTVTIDGDKKTWKVVKK